MSLRSAIRAMSLRTEACIVIGVAFGYFIFGALYSVFHPDLPPHISERHLQFLCVYETLVLALLGAFLWLRGWTPKRLGLRPTTADTLIGVILAAANYAVYVLIWLGLSAANMAPTYLGGHSDIVAGRLTIPTVIAVSAINPVFEELFVCGYIITAGKENGRLALAVNASVAIRLAYHLYQGGAGVVGIIPFGLMCAWWYGRTGRLWPVIVAHAAADLSAMSNFLR